MRRTWGAVRRVTAPVQIYIGVVVAALLMVADARGEPPQQIELEIVVSQISEEAGSIDPRAERLHRELSKQWRYQSLRVLETRRMKLAIDEVGELELPTGRKIRVKPLLVDERGALLAVDLEGTLQTDMRVKNGHLVIIGADRYEQGKLVISLEAHF